MERGGASFHFVTDGVHSVLNQARAAAGKKDVCVAGGVQTAQAFLEAGFVDELQLHLAPVLLGGGLLLFVALDTVTGLERVRVVQSQHVTHLTYRPKEK